MDGVDVVVISAGYGAVNKHHPLAEEQATIAVNVMGFSAIANSAYHYFAENGGGHIVGISSIAGLRGGVFPAYSASKAYISNYLEGLACRSYSEKNHIVVTDIRPGFVDTAMLKSDTYFWRASVDKAAQQIFIAIKNKRRVAYITTRWWIIRVLLALLPFKLYRKIAG